MQVAPGPSSSADAGLDHATGLRLGRVMLATNQPPGRGEWEGRMDRGSLSNGRGRLILGIQSRARGRTGRMAALEASSSPEDGGRDDQQEPSECIRYAGGGGGGLLLCKAASRVDVKVKL
ncbi:hypothetical protein CKAH01_12576 [Colletotrichum kahawae]|uniref:Uncharacterized protein n=1 Tax=Colletotrichum kahawae TaxID=34407 RepID=A0AAD9YQJ4_COLKA|nr:hypothetical protein CKAH01_12576 [Colletotrichum kahawae]